MAEDDPGFYQNLDTSESTVEKLKKKLLEFSRLNDSEDFDFSEEEEAEVLNDYEQPSDEVKKQNLNPHLRPPNVPKPFNFQADAHEPKEDELAEYENNPGVQGALSNILSERSLNPQPRPPNVPKPFNFAPGVPKPEEDLVEYESPPNDQELSNIFPERNLNPPPPRPPKVPKPLSFPTGIHKPEEEDFVEYESPPDDQDGLSTTFPKRNLNPQLRPPNVPKPFNFSSSAHQPEEEEEGSPKSQEVPEVRPDLQLPTSFLHQKLLKAKPTEFPSPQIMPQTYPIRRPNLRVIGKVVNRPNMPGSFPSSQGIRNFSNVKPPNVGQAPGNFIAGLTPQTRSPLIRSQSPVSSSGNETVSVNNSEITPKSNFTRAPSPRGNVPMIPNESKPVQAVRPSFPTKRYPLKKPVVPSFPEKPTPRQSESSAQSSVSIPNPMDFRANLRPTVPRPQIHNATLPTQSPSLNATTTSQNPSLHSSESSSALAPTSQPFRQTQFTPFSNPSNSNQELNSYSGSDLDRSQTIGNRDEEKKESEDVLTLDNGDKIPMLDVYKELKNEVYFHAISSSAVSHYLKDETFLLRPSSQHNDANPLTLCLKHRGMMFFFTISKRRTEEYAIGSEKEGELRFKRIQEMISYYQKYYFSFQGQAMTLSTPATLSKHDI